MERPLLSQGILPREGVQPLFDCHEKADVFGIGADLSGLSQVRDVLKMAYETGFGALGGMMPFFHRSTCRGPCGCLPSRERSCIDVVRTGAVRCVISLECTKPRPVFDLTHDIFTMNLYRFYIYTVSL